MQVSGNLIERFWKDRIEKDVSYLTESFNGGPAIELFGDPVPTDHAVTIIANNDGVKSRIEHAGLFSQHFALFLSSPALGDISKDQDSSKDGSVRPSNWGPAVIDRYFGIVPRNEQGVVSQTDNSAFPHRPERRVLRRLARLLIDDLKCLFDAPARCFVLFPASEQLRNVIHITHATRAICGYHAITDTRERHSEALRRLDRAQALLTRSPCTGEESNHHNDSQSCSHISGN